jgi:acyl-CoA thioesterase-2
VTTVAERLLEILELEVIEENLYRGQNENRGGGRLFGGQVLAQALLAANRTVEDRFPHSLHGYFLRPGDSARPVLYEVERIRDGKSFTTRRVVAVQNGRAIFNMDASFQVTETGFNHGDIMPNVPLPDDLEDDVDVARGAPDDDPRVSPWARFERPFETRSVYRLGSTRSPSEKLWNPVWVKFRGDLADASPALTSGLLAYASDMGMVSTSALPHADEVPRARFQMASLDHALWFHRPLKVDEWLLFVKHTSTAIGARGMNDAAFFNTDGQLVASVSQEGLMRVARESV